MAGFDVATAVLRAGERDGLHAFSAELDPEWQIATKPNGGYLLALLARAAVRAVGPQHPHPTAVSAHFLSAPDAGPAEVEVEVLRVGRSASQARARLYTGGKARVEALVTCGVLTDSGDAWWTAVDDVALPPLEQCLRLPVDGPGFRVPLLGVVEEHMDPATLQWAGGNPTGDGELRAWVRFVDGREPDPLSLLLAVDCLPPATFDLGTSGWVPTLELTAYVRSLPAPGPLRVRQRARLVTEDRVDEQCDVVDAAGHLVATGHQLAGVRVPDRPAPTRR